MNYFVYNGVRSCDMGLRIESKDVFSAPKYDVKFLSIPGRDGDLIAGDGRFPNLQVTYTVYLPAKSITELSRKITLVKSWLYSDLNSYHTLTDTYDTDFYRMAVFATKLDIEDQMNRIGMFTITFSCKPFRYSTEGNVPVSFVGDGYSITNPYPFTSKPFIRILGTGEGSLTLTTPNHTAIWTFTEIDGHLDIDSEQMNFYKGTVPMNDTVSGSGFPLLYSGDNEVAFSGDITEVQITPRWCCL